MKFVILLGIRNYFMYKLKVLIGCWYFTRYTGSELYVYELAKHLVKLDCDVSIVASYIGFPLNSMAEKEGIKVYDFNTLPKNEKYDIIHSQHQPVVNELNKLYPNIPKISTIHSEVISIENPIIHPSIKKYIAIREPIKDKMIRDFNIHENTIDIVYNPIDESRFNTNNVSDNNYILFIGSFEHLRRNPVLDLCNYAKECNKEFWIVGSMHVDYIEKIIKEPHVKYFQPTYNVEDYIKNCSETGGILLGRTTIEGWMCGKKGWIYDVDEYGSIRNKTLTDVPDDIDKFYASNVAKEIKNIYISIL